MPPSTKHLNLSHEEVEFLAAIFDSPSFTLPATFIDIAASIKKKLLALKETV